MLLVFLLFSMNFLFFHPVQEPALTVLPVWDRKGTNFFLPSKFFLNFLKKFSPSVPTSLSSPFAERKGRNFFLSSKIIFERFLLLYLFQHFSQLIRTRSGFIATTDTFQASNHLFHFHSFGKRAYSLGIS